MVLTLALGSGCGVHRPSPGSNPEDAAALARLGRGSEALENRLTLARLRLEDLNHRLVEVQLSQARVRDELVEAEALYQQLQGDLTGVDADVEQARTELEATEARRQALGAELASAQAALRELEAALAAGRVALDVARRTSVAQQAEGEGLASQRSLWRARLASFRLRWGLSEEAWLPLLRELGLTDPGSAVPRAPPAPAEPPEGASGG